MYRTWLLIILLSISSCKLTHKLWSNRLYEETVTQFFIGEDGKYIALIGVNYHYVFSDDSGLLKRLLSLKKSGIFGINPNTTRLVLEENNDINGYLVMDGPVNFIPKEDIAMLNMMGFKSDRNGNISFKIYLSGRRYLPRYLRQDNATSNMSYTIPIYARPTTAGKIGKAAVTPITATLDAVILIGKIILFPLKGN